MSSNPAFFSRFFLRSHVQRTIIVGACALLMFGAMSLNAAGQEGPPPPRTGQPRSRAGAKSQMKPRRPIVDKLQGRIDEVLRTRLQLTDEQFTKLRAMNGALDEERMSIRADEASTRRELRQQLLPGATPNDARVTELLDKLPIIERRRIALQEREQKELSGFLQPAQRARYYALQDEIRRSLQDVQRERGGFPGDSAGPPPGGRGRGGRMGGGRPPGPPDFE